MSLLDYSGSFSRETSIIDGEKYISLSLTGGTLSELSGSYVLLLQKSSESPYSGETPPTAAVTIRDAAISSPSGTTVGASLAWDDTAGVFFTNGPININSLVTAGITEVKFSFLFENLWDGQSGSGNAGIISGILSLDTVVFTTMIGDPAPTLTGDVTVTVNGTTVTVTITNASYDGGDDFTLVAASSETVFGSDEIGVTNGSGSAVYSDVPPGTYNVQIFTYSVSLGGGQYSDNSLFPNEGITVDEMATSNERLTFDYLFSTNSGNTYTFNILGEVGYTGATYQETITLGVPVSEMNKVLVYSGNWGVTGPDEVGSSGASGTYYQPQPAVALMLREFVRIRLDDFTTALTGGSGASYASSSSLITGYTGTSCHDLPYSFQNISGFTYSSVAGSSAGYLAVIPQEAITSYTVSPAGTTGLSYVVGNRFDVGNPGGNVPSSGSSFSGPLQSLFEQAVVAKMIQVENETSGNELNTTPTTTVTGASIEDYFANQYTAAGETYTAASPIYGASFSVGQELAFYVEYKLSKTRTYNLTGTDLAMPNSTSPVELVFGGVTFSLAGLTETSSNATPVIYKIVLQAI